MNYKYEQQTCRLVRNTSGQHFLLTVNKFQCGYEISLRAKWKHKFQTKVLFLLIIYAICFIEYLIQYLNLYHFIVLLLISLILIYQITSILKLEKLIVVKNVGYQIEETYFIHKKNTFIPWDSIEDIFINEVILMQQVLFFITIQTEQPKLFTLFKVTKPCLEVLKGIYPMLKSL